MRLPSCILACFGSTVSAPEVESSHFSVGKSAGPSNAACSGVLSSFMSKRSGSRATSDISATDITKTRVMAVKTSGADIVTMATARYLELFATAPKNDEAAGSLSEPRVGQDSMRFVCTASEYHVSRSSTLTAMGRASREASRLAGAHHQQLQHPANPASGPTPGAQRRSVSSRRRSGPHFPLPEPPASPTAATSEPAQPPAQPAPAPRKHLQLAPFTNKTRSLAATSRSRSDRLSPSAAACLLPSPSIKSIARAHTALPATSAGSTGLSYSASAGDLQDGASGGSAANGPTLHAAGGGIRPSAFARTSTGYIPSPSAAAAAPADVKLPAPVVRRSRLQTESGSSGPVVSIGGPGSTTGAVDLGASGQPCSRHQSHVFRSSASGRVGRAPPFRRASIHFCRDGDVTVTGLPPSCLTAGRAPRRKDTSGGLPFAGGLPSGPEGSGSLLGSTGAAPGAYMAECGFCLGASFPPEVVQAIFLGSRSHDSASRCPPSHELAQAGHSASLAGLASMMPPMVERTPRVEAASDGAALDGKQAADCPDTGAARVKRQEVCQEPTRREEEEQQQQQQAAEKRVQDGANLLELANSSSEGQRCDWGGSSMYIQSRCSNSSRLTHGNMTAGAMTGTTSQFSHNMMSDKLAAPHVADAAINNVNTAAAGGSRDLPPLPPPAESAGPQNEEPMMTTAAHTGSGASFVGFPAGCLGTELSTMIGLSSAMNEPTDVTSALTRLQEACMAAVAQGDMRSQRLCKRNSAELPNFLVQMQQHRSGGVDECTERGSNMGPNRIMGAVGAGGLWQPVACAGAGAVERGSSVRTGGNACPSFARTASAHVPVAAQAPHARPPVGRTASQRTATGACRSMVPSPAQPGTSADAVAGNGTGTPRATDDQPWVSDSRTVHNASRRIGIAMDGQRREPEAAATLEIAAGASSGAGRGQLAEDGADTAAEEYRARLLNVLLRGDFLHDTCDSVVPGSEDDDDGVVEYRYGGFELGGGGGEADYSFRRQASFMEAVRKCATFNPASNIAAAFGAGAGAGGGGGAAERSARPPSPGAP